MNLPLHSFLTLMLLSYLCPHFAVLVCISAISYCLKIVLHLSSGCLFAIFIFYYFMKFCCCLYHCIFNFTGFSSSISTFRLCLMSWCQASSLGIYSKILGKEAFLISIICFVLFRIIETHPTTDASICPFRNVTLEAKMLTYCEF
jgi:hypothetical protein